MKRREFLQTAGLLGIDTFFSLSQGKMPLTVRLLEKMGSYKTETADRFLSHPEYIDNIGNWIKSDRERETFVEGFKGLMKDTARNCISDGNWLIPSDAYKDAMFARDSFWLLGALRNKELSQLTVDRFKEDQATYTKDGHIATALPLNGSKPENRDRDEESTIMYVMHNFLLKQLGGNVDKQSLEKAYLFIASHVENARYITEGEKRTWPPFDSELDSYHYWADTFRPSGEPKPQKEVIAYNQGIYCVALRCLEKLGVPLDPEICGEAEAVYASMVNPEDGVSLPQREGTTIVDVSALVGEALSLYFFDVSILGREKVKATINRLKLNKETYWNGSFLGFKIISDFYGHYRPQKEFTLPQINQPGDYQNGGSWFLYDILALYSAVRNGIDVEENMNLMVARMESEIKYSWASHEFLSTNPLKKGWSDPRRDGYGWNTFILALLP